MAEILDPETVERLRTLPPRKAYDEIRDAIFRRGGATSEEFMEIFEEMVECGILTQEELEEFNS